ncbi:MAG: glycosyltransferase family 2 protein, partial [Candidatus Rokubacteria bacterium]|nr:glycosyltransferase family 2 protein [Candidatus Rokubacteria bacterium]
MRNRLSVAVIALNEEERLRACLESVAWADEIVVVDAGSSDKTAEIAREFTDRVLFHPWEGYAAQKNYALAQSRHPWLLSLDADELVSPALHAEIEEVLERDGPADGYQIPRQNIFLGRAVRHGTLYPDYQLRLFRRGLGAFVPTSVHESVRVEGRTARLAAPLIHESYRS